MEVPIVGLTAGDINGIGLEVILKTLGDERILHQCTPVIYGSSKVVSYHKNILEGEDVYFHNIQKVEEARKGKINVLNCWQETVNISLGKISTTGGKYAHIALDAATQDAKNGKLDAIITAPINKKAMNMAGFKHSGHTEFLTESFGVNHSLMLMVYEGLRVGLLTNHLPISQVAEHITEELIMQKVKLLNETLKVDFGIEKPLIAMLGLNPHAGDNGTIGQEDEQVMRPAIEKLKQEGVLVMGPFAADGFFGSGQFNKYDAVMATYHDQGLVPFKTLAFGGGVNFTAGLPCIRTSPGHGTAFEIAGQNKANHAPFQEALFEALRLLTKRRRYIDMHENPILNKVELSPETE